MTDPAEAEERFRIACDASHTMVYEIDVATKHARFIYGLQALAGYEIDSELQDEGWWLSRIHEDDLPSVLEQLGKARVQRKDYCVHYRVRHQNGDYIAVEDSGRNVTDPDGKVRSIGCVTNITQLKQAAAALLQKGQKYQEFAEDLERMVQQRTSELRQLAAELTLAEERERKRLAQLIHDDLQQLLVGAKFCADTLAKGVQTEELKETVLQLKMFLHQAIESSRSLTFELSPPVLHDMGLGRALHHLAKLMASKHRLVVNVNVDVQAEPRTEEVRILLYQCTRELLFNVVKHARVRTAEVEMRRIEGDLVQVTVSDSGAGFDPEKSGESSESGFGLSSIRGRLGLTGGRLEIESAPGTGSRCSMIAPLGAASISAKC